MKQIVCYHGTTKVKCQNILSTGTWVQSEGTHHWLGDGIYFFDAELDAIDWVTKFGQEAALLEAELNVEDKMLFDLDSQTGLRIFQDIAGEILENIDKYGIRIDSKNKIDGFVLNFIYNNIYQFHVVKRTFYFYLREFGHYQEIYRTSVSRFMREQLQYNVREAACIVNVREKGIA